MNFEVFFFGFNFIYIKTYFCRFCFIPLLTLHGPACLKLYAVQATLSTARSQIYSFASGITSTGSGKLCCQAIAFALVGIHVYVYI